MVDHIQIPLLGYKAKNSNKAHQYKNSVTVALNHNKIKKIHKVEKKYNLFINKYKWEGIHFSSEKHYLKKFEKNNITIVLNVLYDKREKIMSCLCFKT